MALSGMRLFAAATILGFCAFDTFAQSNQVTPRLASSTSAQPATGAASTQTDPLLVQIDNAIEVTAKRTLTANYHSPWQIFHGLLALKRDFELKLGDSRVNAIEWIATNEPRFDNQPLLLKTEHGAKFHPFTRKYAFEGHPAQFMALMSQSDLPVDYTFKIGNERFMIADFLNNIMKEVNAQEEVTWVLWCLQHYLKPDATWLNQRNEQWSIPRLVQIETAAPVVGTPCGGNHRLFALKRTLNKHLKYGGRLEGVWAQADLKIRQHVELARSLQNSDGSLSAKFYAAPGVTNDLNERFNTTGHTMEFLSISLPDERLNEPWVRNVVHVLSNELIVYRQRQIDCGPLYHSLNSLVIYRDRVRGLQQSALANAKPVSTPLPKLAERTIEVKASAKVAEPVPAKEPVPATEALPADVLKLDGAKSADRPGVEQTLPSLAPPKTTAPQTATPQADKPSAEALKTEDSKSGANQSAIPSLQTTAKPVKSSVSVSGKVNSAIQQPNSKPVLLKPSPVVVVTIPVPSSSPKPDSKNTATRPVEEKKLVSSGSIDFSRIGDRIVQKQSAPQKATGQETPALLPKVEAVPLEKLDALASEPGSLSSSLGTQKPQANVAPAPSRFATLRPGLPAPNLALPTVMESISIPAPLPPGLLEIDEEPVSALDVIK